ncbi:MAG TPA: cbb3-type cytochrome c oxidase subunit II, partial [Oceanipulchritudo sp.]|nr:cbb3-type cytochrome c oxidase subunit II [Oceanipulchritudo sp.]
NRTKPTTASSIDRGRQVYLSEGCIHCHSRYVRPDTRDELLWGPVIPLDDLRKEAPVLIGNRRTGPDLLNVGNRRSRGWLKQHFLAPQSLSPRSAMPSYAHLFAEGSTRGDDLIDFLVAPGLENLSERYQAISSWQPGEGNGTRVDARRLFARSCASCHGPNGEGNGPLASLWSQPPANLAKGPFAYSAGPDAREKLHRIIKFGIPGTDMPGHETLGDEETIALANFIFGLRGDSPTR